MRRIAIVGTGLIGGSFGLAVAKEHPEMEIVGFDRPDVLERALAAGAVTGTAASLEDAVSGAGLVVLATPLRATMTLLPSLAEILNPGTVVMDTGSVKAVIVNEASRVLAAENPFIGGHPMAGSESSGIENADSYLFENATFALCPAPGTAVDSLEGRFPEIIQLLRDIGSQIIVLTAERHDAIAAAVSHLPQLLAVALINTVDDLAGNDEAYLKLAAGGFRDVTRIASSPPDIWKDIIRANHRPIMDVLARFAATIQRFRNRVIEEDVSAIMTSFDRARVLRNTIPRNTKGFLYPLVDIYVGADDKPGVLKRLTGSLADADVNIKDIELLKLREGTGGTFRLGFDTADTANRAVEILNDAGFDAFTMT